MPTQQSIQGQAWGLSGSSKSVQQTLNNSSSNSPVGGSSLAAADPTASNVGGNSGACPGDEEEDDTGIASISLSLNGNSPGTNCMDMTQLNGCTSTTVYDGNRTDPPRCPWKSSPNTGSTGAMGGSGSGSSPLSGPNGGVNPSGGPQAVDMGGGFGGSADIQGFQSIDGAGAVSTTVNLATGNIHHRVSVAGAPSLSRGFEFSLSYSAEDHDYTDGPLATTWRHSHQASMDFTYADAPLPSVDFYTGGGQKLVFVKPNGFSWMQVPDTTHFENIEVIEPFTSDIWQIKETTSETVWKFDRANEGRIVSIEDRLGNETTYTYNTSGQLTTITEETGRTITLAYTGDVVTSVTDPNGNVTLLSYDSHQNLVEVSGPEGCTTTLSYTDNANSVLPEDHLITSRTDARGNVTSYQYNSGGQISKIIDPEGRELNYDYETIQENIADVGYGYGITPELVDLKVTNVTMPDGETYEYRFDISNNLWRTILPSGISTRYVWNEKQRLLGVSEGFQLPNHVYYGNSPQNDLDGPTENALNRSTQYTVNPRGDTVASMDATGIVSTYSYDSQGHLTSVTPAQAHYGIGGDWPSYFGEQGFILCAFNEDDSDIYQAPSYLNSNLSTAITNGAGGGSTFTRLNNNHDNLLDPRIPIAGGGSLKRGSGHWKAVSTFEFAINLSSTEAFNLSLYTHSGDKDPYQKNPLRYFEQFGRDITFEVEDLEGTQTFRVHNNAPGVWVTFPVKGDSSNPIVVRVSRNAGQGDAVLNAIAFDPYQDRRSFFEYTNGYLTKVTNGLDQEMVYSYNSDGTLGSATDPRSVTTNYYYLDSYKNLTKIVDGLNGETLFEYDANGNVTKVTDPNLNETTMLYDGKNRLLSVTDALSHSMSYDYDGNGNVLSVTDAKNRVTSYTYTDCNRLESVTNPMGQTVEMEYNVRGLLAKVTDPRGFSTLYFYDEDGKLSRVETPDGQSTTLSYDTLHQLVAVTGPNGNQADTADIILSGAKNLFRNPGAEQDNPHKDGDQIDQWKRGTVTVARNSSQSYEGSYSFPFSQVGQTWTQTDIDAPIGAKMIASAQFKPTSVDPGVTTTLRLSAELRNFSGSLDTESVDTDLPGSTNTWVETEKLLLEMPGKAQTTYSNPSMDSFSAKLVTLGGGGNVQAWLDEFKLHSLSTSFKRDPAGRTRSVSTPDGAESRVGYDRCGRAVLLEDPHGLRTSVSYDSLDRVVETVSPTGESTKYTYDLVGNLHSFTDARDKQTVFTYDNLNRLTQITYHDSTTETFAYDAGSRLTGHTDIATNSRTFGYDDGNRLTSITYSVDSSTITLVPDEVGKITSFTDRNGDVTTFGYDLAYRVTSVSRAPATGNTTPDWSLSYSYNDSGQRVRVSEGQTPTVLWQVSKLYGVNRYGESALDGYDGMGRLKGISGPNSLSVGYSYDHESRLKKLDYGNGVNTEVEYDIVGRVKNLDISDNTSNLLSIEYWYDQKSQRTAQVTGNTSFDYKLDQEGRLIGEAVNRFVQVTGDDFRSGSLSQTEIVEDGLKLLNLSDDFSGNGLNTDRWTLRYWTTDDPYLLIGVQVRQDDGLHIVLPRGQTNRIVARDQRQPVRDEYELLPHDLSTNLFHRHPFSGDFDISVDFEEFQAHKGAGFGTSAISFGLTDQVISGASRWYTSITMANSGPSFHVNSSNYSAGTAADSGRFRFTRVGTLITAYIWDSGSWVTYTSWNTTRSGDLWLYLEADTVKNECFHGTFKNLLIANSYPTSGEFESTVYDAGRTVTWDQLSWTEDLPSGCDVEFQIATSASEDGPWSYVGPDGTSGTKFSTAAGQSVGTSVTGRYLRTKAFLTGSGSATPTVSAIHVSYSGDVTSQYASFTYDDAGNMTTRTLLTDSSFLEETKTYNSLNEIATSSIDDGSTVVNYTYGHDSNGNLTSKTDGTNTWTYTWDDENRLTAVVENSTTIASYEYDSGSRLLKRVAGGTTTNYTWDGWDLIKEEKTGAVTETTRYAVPQGGVQSFVRNGNRYYLHGDGLSSSQLVTDSNGNVAARIIYDAWGNELYASDSVSNGLDARFVGGLGVRNDAATGLIYMRHRWYDASLGRFLSRDPIGFAGGLNLYNYAGVNPVSAADPEGLKTSWDPALTKYERTRIEVFKAEMLKTRKGRILQFFLDDSLEYNFVLTSERLAKSKRTSKEHPGVTLIHTDHFEKDCNGKPRLKPGTYQIVFDIANSPKPGGWMPKTHSPDWAVYPHELGHVYQAMSDPEGYLDGRDGIYRFYSSKRNAILDAVIPRREAYTIRVWEFPILIQAGATYVPSSL